MKDIITKICIKTVSKLCRKMAFTVSASACLWGTYQPREPKCLKK